VQTCKAPSLIPPSCVAKFERHVAQVDTGVDARSTTNGSGFSRFSSVASGHYSVSVSRRGSCPPAVTVVVTTGETRSVDVTAAGVCGQIKRDRSQHCPDTQPGRDPHSNNHSLVGDPKPATTADRDVQMLISLTPGVVGFPRTSRLQCYALPFLLCSFGPSLQPERPRQHSNLYNRRFACRDAINSGTAPPDDAECETVIRTGYD